jgi:hypothetical protein
MVVGRGCSVRNWDASCGAWVEHSVQYSPQQVSHYGGKRDPQDSPFKYCLDRHMQDESEQGGPLWIHYKSVNTHTSVRVGRKMEEGKPGPQAGFALALTCHE